jgi:hypothetical protein
MSGKLVVLNRGTPCACSNECQMRTPLCNSPGLLAVARCADPAEMSHDVVRPLAADDPVATRPLYTAGSAPESAALNSVSEPAALGTAEHCLPLPATCWASSISAEVLHGTGDVSKGSWKLPEDSEDTTATRPDARGERWPVDCGSEVYVPEVAPCEVETAPRVDETGAGRHELAKACKLDDALIEGGGGTGGGSEVFTRVLADTVGCEAVCTELTSDGTGAELYMLLCRTGGARTAGLESVCTEQRWLTQHPTNNWLHQHSILFLGKSWKSENSHCHREGIPLKLFSLQSLTVPSSGQRKRPCPGVAVEVPAQCCTERRTDAVHLDQNTNASTAQATGPHQMRPVWLVQP